MIKNLTFIFISICSLSFGQIKQTASISDSIFIRKLSSTKISHNVRAGIGVQGNFQTEIGYSRMKFTNGCTGFFAKTYYLSIEYVPKTENHKNVIDLKIGIDYNLSILAIGLETKYLTDFENKNYALVPKIGFGFGIINAFYGYNILVNKNLFPSLSKHQFSLILNIPVTSKELKHEK